VNGTVAEFAAYLFVQTTDPLMGEKILTLLQGRSVNR
jgi:hypothetical protein